MQSGEQEIAALAENLESDVFGRDNADGPTPSVKSEASTEPPGWGFGTAVPGILSREEMTEEMWRLQGGSAGGKEWVEIEGCVKMESEVAGEKDAAMLETSNTAVETEPVARSIARRRLHLVSTCWPHRQMARKERAQLFQLQSNANKAICGKGPRICIKKHLRRSLLGSLTPEQITKIESAQECFDQVVLELKKEGKRWKGSSRTGKKQKKKTKVKTESKLETAVEQQPLPDTSTLALESVTPLPSLFMPSPPLLFQFQYPSNAFAPPAATFGYAYPPHCFATAQSTLERLNMRTN